MPANDDLKYIEMLENALLNLVDVFIEKPGGYGPGLEAPNGDAPGHYHHKPGIWDSDNGDMAGTKCERCAAWRKAKEQVKVIKISRRIENAS